MQRLHQIRAATPYCQSHRAYKANLSMHVDKGTRKFAVTYLSARHAAHAFLVLHHLAALPTEVSPVPLGDTSLRANLQVSPLALQVEHGKSRQWQRVGVVVGFFTVRFHSTRAAAHLPCVCFLRALVFRVFVFGWHWPSTGVPCLTWEGCVQGSLGKRMRTDRQFDTAVFAALTF